MPCGWGKRLVEARKRLGIKQEELAAAVGVSQPSVAAYEGEVPKKASLQLLERMATVLRVRPEWLVFGAGTMNGPDPAILDRAVLSAVLLEVEARTRALGIAATWPVHEKVTAILFFHDRALEAGGVAAVPEVVRRLLPPLPA